VAGGTSVVLTGTGFLGATDVTFDGTSAAAVTVDSDTQITVTTPAHAAGATNVIILSPNGNSAPGLFTFDPLPAATSLTPSSGPETGGTPVTIDGSGFTGATDVTVDGVSVPFVVVNDTTVTFTAPAHLPGAVPVVVTGPGGASAPLDFTFTDVPDPVITGLVPDHGPVAGGTSVVITGTGFLGATAVTFNGTFAPAVTVDSDTQITVVTPAHAAGATNVIILSPNGNSAPGLFTFDPLPTATSLTPSTGPETGGTPVTIDGSGFTGATDVTVDGVSVPFVVVNDTTVTFTVPAHLPGAVPVVVTGPGGASAPLDFTFTDVPDPVITGLVPDHGPVAGGTSVVLTGTGFLGATAVTFNGTFAPTVTVDSDTQITVTTPAHAVGATNVIILSPNGNSAPLTFTFDPLPAATSLTPSTGPETGGTPVTIDGSGFTGATDV
ncbi:IPT/TIG domain-containing protein, partial [Cryobacterium sp. MLB-32]|uniref:IPT/TIG domain-containing protein n=1 Tax=Cryobacterium sp. MLB-32 TaxID=1529318 RepID=UPI0005651B0A